MLRQAEVQQESKTRDDKKKKPGPHDGIGYRKRLALVVGDDVIAPEARVVDFGKGGRADTKDGAYHMHDDKKFVEGHTPCEPSSRTCATHALCSAASACSHGPMVVTCTLIPEKPKIP